MPTMEKGDALLIVDVQRDFLPGGRLGVPEGDAVVPVINRYIAAARASLVTSSDAPYFDAVYKLQEYAGKPRRKRSTGKATWPGRKQVFRQLDRTGRFDHDIISLENDARPGTPLLVRVLRNGRRVSAAEPLESIRARAAAQLAALPDRLRALETAADPYRVEVSPVVRALADRFDRAPGTA